MNSTAFVWPQTAFTFEIEERLDPGLFGKAIEAANFLDETLDGLKMDRGDDAFESRLVAIYFATRIFGATASGAMLLAHRLGREAIILGRCQYEYFIKMLFFDHYPEKAEHLLETLHLHNFKFTKKVASEILRELDPDVLERLEADAVNVKDLDFTNGVVQRLKNDAKFLADSNGQNPFATWFHRNIDASFRTHWRYGSTIVHASPVDMPNVVVARDDGCLNVNVDSRMKAPNKTIADLAQRCFSTMGIIRWRFGLQFEPKHIEWAKSFEVIAQRHEDEPTDTRSMHD